MTDMIDTHISARVPGEAGRYLINRYGVLFHEMRASDLVKVDHAGDVVDPRLGPDSVNRAGFNIHSAVHAARPDVACVVHTHTSANIAVAALEEGLLPISQHALKFHRRLGYHDYEGIALDPDERTRLVRDLGPHMAMILRNHGLLTTGASVAAAYMRMNYLDKSARTQLAAMAATRDLRLPPPEIAERTAAQHDRGGRLGEREWPALLRRLDRIDPSFRD
jgi:ribulose-5-phosphate 4-epimerase/fuculose-1-phosphate aldolase